MAEIELLARGPVSAGYPAVDADFDRRWAVWVTRGRVHQQHMRRKFIVWAGVFAMGAAIVYAFVG